MRYVSGSQASGRNAKAARSGMPMALPAAFLHPSMSDRSSSALAEVPTSAKSFWQALMTQLVVAFGSSLESQKSTTTLRPASPPLELTMFAQALTAFTDFWKIPGATGLSTSAIKPTLMVVAVIPTSLAGAALPSGAAEVVPLADVPAAADVAAAGADEELPAELQPAASRAAAASTATSPARRTRTRKRRPGRL